MKKLHIILAGLALAAAVAVGYSATKSPVQPPDAKDRCAGGNGCEGGSCCHR